MHVVLFSRYMAQHKAKLCSLPVKHEYSQQILYQHALENLRDAWQEFIYCEGIWTWKSLSSNPSHATYGTCGSALQSSKPSSPGCREPSDSTVFIAGTPNRKQVDKKTWVFQGFFRIWRVWKSSAECSGQRFWIAVNKLQSLCTFRYGEHSNHNAVRVWRAYADQSIHAQNHNNVHFSKEYDN